MRGLAIKYKFLLNPKFWKHCQNCYKIHGTVYNNGQKCVIKCCKCRKCYVCSKKCQKIMWNKGHRIHCTLRKYKRQ